MSNTKIFIGSSTESRAIAQLVSEILFEYNVESIPWWRGDVFVPGKTFIESLHNVIEEVDGAVMIFAEDDTLLQRDVKYKSVRDNTILEYGLFSGALGRENTVIIQVNNPKFPSDIYGMNVIDLGNYENGQSTFEFKEKCRGKINQWVDHVQRHKNNNNTVNTQQEIATVLNGLKNSNPTFQAQIDNIALDLIKQIPQKLLPIENIYENLIDNISSLLLHDCKGIFALDVVGPSGWITPSAFRYLAPQLRTYMRKNISKDNEWNLMVSDKIETLIDFAINNALKLGLDESLTEFDNPGDFTWTCGEVSLEYVRILLWEKEELLSPIAESIIAIHEIFHVPLLFLEKSKDSAAREKDVILFTKKNKHVTGMVGKRQDRFETKNVTNKQLKSLERDFFNYLIDEKIMFAVDARALLKNKAEI